jgi:hypothetical protein
MNDSPPDSPPSTGPSRFPAFARFFRWFFSWRTLGRVFVVLAALATLIALVGAEENWRGKRAWERYRHELEAQGEKLDWKDYVPPPVPDAQNFAMTPFLAPILDFNPRPRTEGQSLWRDTNGYNRISSLQEVIGKLEQATADRNQPRAALRMTDLPGWAAAFTGNSNQAPSTVVAPLTRAEAAAAVLRGLQKYDSVVEELRSASQRPYARFNIRYEDEFAPAILLPHLACLKQATLLFQVRASAELALGQTDLAWSDTRMGLYLADTLKEEPFLISKLVQVALDQLALKPIWEGLAEHRWSAAQLLEIEQRLGKIDLLADAAMRGERALSIRTMEQLRGQGIIDADDLSKRLPGLLSFLLGGFFYQNELSIARMYQQFFVPVADVANQRIYPSRADANDAALAKAVISGFRPYNLFARMLLPAISQAETKFAFGQTQVNEAIVACALERYRLAQGQFPESLEPLTRGFLSKLPHDVITGAPLIYRRTPDGQFILYSVGWNEKDDGGTIVLPGGKDHKRDLTEGDWVWQYPTPAAPPAQTAASQ